MTSAAREVYPPVLRVEACDRRLRILFVYSRLPLPMMRGDQLTVAHLLAFLKARGHDVDLLTLDPGEECSAAQRAWIGRQCRRLQVFPQSRVASLLGLLGALLRGHPLQVGWFHNPRQLDAILKATESQSYDIAYCYYLRSAETLRHISAERPLFKILALQLSQSLNTRRMMENKLGLPHRVIYAIEHRLVRSYEARIWRHFDRTVLIGPRDVQEIRAACVDAGVPEIDNVIYCAHGVDAERFAPRADVAPEPGLVVFSGGMNINTNINAVVWFAEEVWPQIKAAAPTAKLRIVGRNPTRPVRQLAELTDVEVTGRVTDTADHIARATVCVNPMLIGAGMQNKLLEYMAMAKPVVATSVANEGIGAPPDECLLIEDTPRGFADAVVRLLRDPARSAQLGMAARRYVERHWTWEAHFLKLEQAMLEVIDSARAGSVAS
jgi:sugar transferase (PEP-CTERM/EpsH1 system associated)